MICFFVYSCAYLSVCLFRGSGKPTQYWLISWWTTLIFVYFVTYLPFYLFVYLEAAGSGLGNGETKRKEKLGCIIFFPHQTSKVFLQVSFFVAHLMDWKSRFCYVLSFPEVVIEIVKITWWWNGIAIWRGINGESALIFAIGNKRKEHWNNHREKLRNGVIKYFEGRKIPV